MNSFVLDPSKVSSACVCNTNITAKTDLDTCTASTSVRLQTEMSEPVADTL